MRLPRYIPHRPYCLVFLLSHVSKWGRGMYSYQNNHAPFQNIPSRFPIIGVHSVIISEVTFVPAFSGYSFGRLRIFCGWGKIMGGVVAGIGALDSLPCWISCDNIQPSLRADRAELGRWRRCH